MASNSNSGKNPAMTKRNRFNSNPTPCSHAGCLISAQAKRDKEAYRISPQKTMTYVSQAKGIFHMEGSVVTSVG